MKTKIFGGSLVITLAIIASININLNKAENHVGDFTMSSIEALGMCEVFDLTGKIVFQCQGASTCKKTINGVMYTCTGTLVAS